MSVKLSPRDTFLLVLLLCILALVGWYFLYFQARQDQIVSLQQDLDTRSQQLTSYRSARARLPGLRSEIAGLQTERDTFLRALPPSANIGGVVSDIRQNVASAGGDLSGLSIAPGTATGLPAGVRPISLNVTVSGRFQPTFQIIRTLETMSRFSNVNSLALTLPAPDSLDPKLNTTMAMTIYTFDAAGAGTAPATPGAPPPAPAAPAPAGGTQ